MRNILLSIVIPTYNRVNELKSNVLGLCDQVIQNGLENQVEIVVSDNASTDGTALAFHEIAQQFSFVMYRQNEKNLGIDGNVLSGMSVACGNYVWLLGDDDSVVPNGLNDVLTAISEATKKSLGLVVLNYEVYDRKLETKLHGQVSKFKAGVYSDAKTFVGEVAYLLTFISLVILERTSALEKANSKNPYLGSLHFHYFLAITLALEKGFAIISKPIIRFRSGCSQLGAPFWVSLVPYNIIYQERVSLGLTNDELRIAARKAFYAHVLPWITLAKIEGRLSFKDVWQCRMFYWRVPALWLIAVPLLLIPQPLLTLIRHTRKKIYGIAGRVAK